METLQHSVNNLTGVNDFRPISLRPISLMNCVLKLITKLMANKVQLILTYLIHINQYGFIKSRTIQVAWPGHMNTFINDNIHLEAGFLESL